MAAAHPAARIHYHRPPPRGSDEREGDAKAGNLNSALALLAEIAPEIQFIETRDADDLVGDAHFLRRCVGHLLRDARTAYVQTVKEACVSPGDPFDNLQPLFYRGAMLARHAANAVFPCGSGLVWRRTALEDIGGFPTWNLVEDLQSGVEALRRGWRGAYVPIRGAVGQHSPEDLRERLQAARHVGARHDAAVVLGRPAGPRPAPAAPVRRAGPVLPPELRDAGVHRLPRDRLLTGVYPLDATMGPTPSTSGPSRSRSSSTSPRWPWAFPTSGVWKARVLWVGLAPVYMKACVLALAGGRHRKPVYRVTRKHDEHRWYWRLVLPQMAMLAVLLGAMAEDAVDGTVR